MAAPGTCSGSWAKVLDLVEVKSKPTHASAMLYGIAPDVITPCRKPVLGTEYDACGLTCADGWILVQDIKNLYEGKPGRSGYIPSTCTSDTY